MTAAAREALRKVQRQREKTEEAREAKANGHAKADWHAHLLRTKAGPRDCVANVAMILRADPAFAGRLTYNLMRCRTVVGALPWHPCKRPRDWTERDDIALAEWLQLRGVPVKPATCAAAVRTVAAERAVHPLRDRLEGLVWDGKPRLDLWLVTYLGVEDTAYVRAVGRKWMISAVARAFRPGCKADHALILEGAQRALKSTVAEVLALEREWFTDEIAELGTKDSAQDLPGKWIIEIAELSAMRRAMIERIKAFLSRRIDHYRPSYARYSEDFERGCVFIGSTNEGQYLQDTTGNRRFWPVRVGKVEIRWLRTDIEQLWAEAVAAFLNKEEWWLDETGEALAAAATVERLQVDPWEELVLDAVAKLTDVPDPKPVTTNAILESMGVLKDKRDKSMTIRIGVILAADGWERKERQSGKSRYTYLKTPKRMGDMGDNGGR